MEKKKAIPEILAPAGDTDCFLAALAAGADGIYLGLKNFSARMAAKNFGIAELSRLIELAHLNNCKVYVAMNNLIKPGELNQAFRLTLRLAQQAAPDGLIIQDLAMINIARQAGYKGSLAFSTLANITSPAGLRTAKVLGADRVIVPRELSIDELKAMGENCPDNLELECFVHGALCYCVSGRCYWSSYMGGRSGLRGRCAQPCRRKYSRVDRNGSIQNKRGERFFACQDLELGPVIRALLSVPNLACWKIEGRKKGPHYVYHAVTAYKLLRDFPDDAQQRKLALEILDEGLGRPGVLARFLPQKPYQPMIPHGQTASGLLAGKIQLGQDGKIGICTRIPLIPGDLVRIGAEDENWHMTMGIKRSVPKAGKFFIDIPRHKTPAQGTPVYLIDRKEPELQKILADWRKKLHALPERHTREVEGKAVLPAQNLKGEIPNMLVMDRKEHGKTIFPPVLGKKTIPGIWLTSGQMEISRSLYGKFCFWLPPAIWAENERRYAESISWLLRNGARWFVCNAQWQRSLFPQELRGIKLICGPFCNIANSLALEELEKLGFAASFVSPELSGEDLLKLPDHSPLPLGMVIQGFWPVGISRFGLVGLNNGEAFQSPGGEIFWSLDRRDLTWIFPAWPLDLTVKKAELAEAGYSFFAVLRENPPKGMVARKREGLFNWNNGLL